MKDIKITRRNVQKFTRKLNIPFEVKYIFNALIYIKLISDTGAISDLSSYKFLLKKKEKLKETLRALYFVSVWLS